MPKPRTALARTCAALLAAALVCVPSYALAQTRGADQLSLGTGSRGQEAPATESAAAGATVTVQGATQAALQNALDTAGKSGSASSQATVVVPAGTYRISKLLIPANVAIQAKSGAVFTVTGRIQSKTSGTTAGGYAGAGNISISGGTWNCGTTVGPFVFYHANKLRFTDMTITGGRNHIVNVAASKDVQFTRVTFRNQGAPTGSSAQAQLTAECVHTDHDIGESPAADGTPAGDVVLDSCTFDNVYACVGKHGSSGKKRYSGTSLTVKYCNFVNVKGRCVNLGNQDNAKVFGNHLTGSYPKAFLHAVDSRKIQLFNNSRYAAIQVRQGSSITVDGGVIASAQGAGVAIHDGSTATLNKVTIASPSGNGVEVTGGNGAGSVTMQSCVVKNAGDNGVYLANVSNCTVKDCIIQKSKNIGILLNTVKNSTIANNNVQDSTSHGILLDAACNKVSVTGNTSNSNINKANMAEFLIKAQCTNITLKNNRYGPRQFWIDTRSISQSGNSQRSYASLSLKSEPEVASGVWKRLAGADRFGTMSAVVGAGWAAGSGGTVVVATAKGFADALAASGVAGVERAPVVITAPGSLSPQAAEQLRRIRPKRVVIAGGPSAVSNSVASAVARAAGVAPVRLWGENARRTAEALALEYKGSWSGTAILATQRDYADALSAAPAAYAMRMPVFLVSGPSSLDAQTVSAMRACGITRVQVVGGEKAVGEPVMRALRAAGFQVPAALAGTDRYGTSAEVARWALARGMSANNMGVATGRSCYDALCGAALCGRNNAVLVLADARNSSNVGSGAASVTRPNRLAIRRGYVFGGPAAVSTPVFNALDASTS